jgi:type VI secretion system protein VasG
MKQIVELKLGKIRNRVRESYRADFSYSPELVQEITDRCQEVETGARNIDHILTRTLLPELAQEFLARTARGEGVSRVNITLDTEGGFVYEID